MFQQAVFFLSALAVVSSLGYSSKKNDYQKPGQYESVASHYAAKPQVPIETLAAPSPYSFGYDSDGSSRQESGDASGRVTGSYSVTNEDGSMRLVKYVADENGFRANVDTDEPGTKTHQPASANVKSAFMEPAAPKKAPVMQATHAPTKTNYEQTHHYSTSQVKQQPIQVHTYSTSPVKQQPFEDSKPVPYSFSYNAQLEDGSSARSESGDGSGQVTGQYALSAADGRTRTVHYTADAAGFRAKIETNEPGTEEDSPADATFYLRCKDPEGCHGRRRGTKAPKSMGTHQFQQQQTHDYSTSQVKQQPIQVYSTSPVKQQPFEDSKPIPYSFSYDAQLEDGSSARSESGDGSGKVTGHYALSAADGRTRTVHYTADADGFRAKIDTNEFGTKPDSPADVMLYSNAPIEAPTHYSAKKQDHYSQKTVQPFSQKKVEHDQYAQKPTELLKAKTTLTPRFSQKQVQPDHFSQKPAVTHFSQQKVEHNQYSQKPTITQPFSQKTVESTFGGQSAVQYNSGAPSGYSFNYVAELEDGGSSSRTESADGSGKVVGSYSLSGPDGRMRTVDYTSSDGFRATVKTNEAGTKSDSPADAMFYSSAPQVEEPKAHPMSYAAAGQYAGVHKQQQKTHFTQQKFDASPSFEQQQPSPYSFGYDSASGARQESGDASGAVSGSYSVMHEDGSRRLVQYVADAGGFRAKIDTNEAGTKADESPADAVFTSVAGGHFSEQKKGQFPAPTYSQKSISQQKIWRRR